MHSSLTITEAAESIDLVTLARVKLELGITDADSDGLLESKITETSAAIAEYCNRVFALERVTEKFRFGGEADVLTLRRWPVAEIHSVTVDGTVLDESEYEIDTGDGTLTRLWSDTLAPWSACYSIQVDYSAGYVLPGQAGDGPSLPADITAAALQLIQMRVTQQGQAREFDLRSIEIPGVVRKEYFDTAAAAASTTTGGTLPVEIAAMLYRHIQPATGAYA